LKDNSPHMMEGIRTGNESVFKQLFQDYYRPLTVFALKYLADLESAKEIVQDLFVHLYENRRTLAITISLESYLYQSVRNRCLNHIKKQQGHQKHLKHFHNEQPSHEDMEAEINKNELEHRIFRIISDLPPQCRNIFTLSRVRGLKNNEIAEQLGISKRTVETQISNALKALRSKL